MGVEDCGSLALALNSRLCISVQYIIIDNGCSLPLYFYTCGGFCPRIRGFRGEVQRIIPRLRFLYHPPPPSGNEVEGGGILESLCPSVLVSMSPSVRMSGVCLNDIFWTAQPFVANLSCWIHHHEPECHAERLVFIFWTADPFFCKLCSVIHSS